MDELKGYLFDLLDRNSSLINVGELLSVLTKFLPNYQAIELISFFSKKDFKDFKNYKTDCIKIDGVNRFYLKKVLEHYPVSYVTKNRNFFGRDFYVDERVLIPRHETELLVETALKYTGKGSKILDLCTGSGAILFTIAIEASISYGLGIDKSYPALEVAHINRDIFSIGGCCDLLCGDVFDVASFKIEEFDVVTCNPPYVSMDDCVEDSVLYEPKMAIFAEDKGFFFYKKLLRILSKSCRKDAVILFEIGHGMVGVLSEIFFGKNIYFIKDYSGIERVMVWINS
ncbi:MAG: peptide chain release factor N(5)-glutamine methyltransferase [Calditerrivibrio sp.]|nr:peptide chain release factor N(5)-glutamine methyltransferase [Calditerrivibrio sp.]MCA1980836.1 peptide chain release factor N(5)-glutamine methyltransferase [Calditerrivibrio sp.]